MKTETNADVTGTGQAGAGAPAGTKKDIPAVEGDKLDQLAGHVARKGFDRQQREDPTEFTK